MALLKDFYAVLSDAKPLHAFDPFYSGIPNRRLSPLDVADIGEVVHGVSHHFNDEYALTMRIAFGENLLAASRLPLTQKTIIHALPVMNILADAFARCGREDEGDRLIYRALDTLVQLRGNKSEVSKTKAREWLTQAQAGSPEYHGRFAITSPQHPYPSHVTVLDVPLEVKLQFGDRLHTRFRYVSTIYDGGTSWQIRPGLPEHVDAHVVRAKNPRVLLLTYVPYTPTP